MAMNFLEADLTPELELNEILWMSVRGADSKMPPPVRSGFIRAIERRKSTELLVGARVHGCTGASGAGATSAGASAPVDQHLWHQHLHRTSAPVHPVHPLE